jgi:hypothetical protein
VIWIPSATRRAHPAGPWLALSAALAVALLAGAAPASAGPVTASGVRSSCAGPTSAPPLELEYSGRAAAAGPLMRRLAGRLRPAAEDATTGRFAFVDATFSAADSTLDAQCVQTVTAYAAQRRWRADDGAGQVTATPWHTDRSSPPAVVTTRYLPGELPGVLDGPVPLDPAVLAAALDASYSITGRVAAVAELAGWHYLDLPARRAVLTVLAGVPELVYRGVVDGWPGIAVSVDVGDVRDVLVLDPRTGVVVGAEQVLLRGGEAIGVTTPYSLARTTYLERGRTAVAGLVAARAVVGCLALALCQ